MRETITDAQTPSPLRSIVVWIPILHNDELTSARQASAIFRRTRVPQFWDGAQLAGKEVSRSMGEPGEVAWDIYLFYRRGVEWTDAGIPSPDAALAQDGAAGGVVASTGTLPPRGDQSRLPPYLANRAVIAGTYGELPRLLGQVASRFR